MSVMDIQVDGYDIQRKIGSGSYSVVYKAVELSSGEDVAIKCVMKNSLSTAGRDNIVQEIKIMKMLKNPFVVNMRDFQYDDRFIYLILDYCDGGDLSHFIKSRNRLSEAKCRKLMQQLALGLKFLRSKHITHFDLKPQNLLLVTRPALSLKIGDFGLSGFLSDEARCNVLKGSPLYMAPEILLGTAVDPKADLWSVGVIFYECFFGAAPLAHSNCRQLVQILSKQAPINVPPGLSEAADDLLRSLLVIRPDERISFDEYFSHPFLDLEHYPLEESYAKAVSFARKAVKLDYEKNYLEAFNVYGTALSYLVPFLHTPLTPEREEFIRKKVMEYFRRAEQLKSVLYRAKETIGNETVTVSEILSKPRRPQSSEEKQGAAAAAAAAPAVEVSSRNLHSESSSINQLYRTFNQLALVQQPQPSVSDVRLLEKPEGKPLEKTPETYGEIDLKALSKLQRGQAMCASTPKMKDAIDIGLTAQMYLCDGNYQLSMDHFKLSLSILVPMLENEPHGARRALLTTLTKEWLKEAESVGALIAAVEGTNALPSSQREESCVIQ